MNVLLTVEVFDAPADRDAREMIADRISRELAETLVREFPEYEAFVSVDKI